MNQKTQRLSFIRKIIRSEFISSQEELIARLEECGVKITQSTLSRDLKFMHVAKVPHKEKGYIYVLPNNTRNDHSISTIRALLRCLAPLLVTTPSSWCSVRASIWGA